MGLSMGHLPPPPYRAQRPWVSRMAAAFGAWKDRLDGLVRWLQADLRSGVIIYPPPALPPQRPPRPPIHGPVTLREIRRCRRRERPARC